MDSIKAIRNRGLSEKVFSRHLRSLWVIDGFLVHGFQLSLLTNISNVYERINCVPEGYHQADLWASKQEPAFLGPLKARITD